MRRVLPFLFMMLFGSFLIADIDKHQKYGTIPIEYEPVRAYVNPDFINTYRNAVTIALDGASSGKVKCHGHN